MGLRDTSGVVPGLLCAGLLTLSAAAAAPASSPQDNRSSSSDYQIWARVEPEARSLEGRETITWLNRSEDVVGEVWFHLHHNAYSNNYTTHLWESEGSLRGNDIKAGWSWQEVTSLKVGGRELVEAITFQSPDDGREEDRTVFSVKLPEVVQPGGQLVLEVEWHAQLPRVRRRTGVSGDGNFLLMAHWFPKLGVYEGGRGWNCHQFHASTEFYADFGTYDVTIDLPANYKDKVGASGLQNGLPVLENGRCITRFLAPSRNDRAYTDPAATGTTPRPKVHGFAWTADPDFIPAEGRFVFTDWKRRYPDEVAKVEDAIGMAPDTLVLRDVRIVAWIQPEHEDQAERHIHATAAALFFYGLWFGEYPYEQVTVVDPAWSGRAAGGMEYPTLFTAGTSLFTDESAYRPESVTVHECGHQFWYGLVGNNEYESAWLDEGFNSYTDSEVLIREYGPRRSTTSYSGVPVWGKRVAAVPAASGLAGALTGQRVALTLKVGSYRKKFGIARPLQISPFLAFWRDQPWLTLAEDRQDPRWGDRSGYLSAADVDPVDTDAWLYRDRNSYRTNSYPRPAVALRSLKAVVGEPAFLAGMRHYSSQWRYRHPYPQDFYEAFNEGAGVDVTWYFEEMFEGTGTVDWGVEARQRRTPKLLGMVPGPDGYVEVPSDPEPEEAAPDPEEEGAGDAEDPEDAEDAEDDASDAKPDPSPWIYDVVVDRKGSLRLPVTIEVLFENGEALRFEWTRQAQLDSTWWRLPIDPGPEKIVRVLIDPERRYYLDANMSDNQWYGKKDLIAPLRWSERAFTQYVHLLHWFSSLGG